MRLGQWLTAAQAESLLSVPDLGTAKGMRDYAILALLLTAGLRRSELALLSWHQMQQREERWLIVNLSGKHGRIRSVPIPFWVYAAIAHWGALACIVDGLVFRAVNRHGRVLPHVFVAAFGPQVQDLAVALHRCGILPGLVRISAAGPCISKRPVCRM